MSYYSGQGNAGQQQNNGGYYGGHQQQQHHQQQQQQQQKTNPLAPFGQPQQQTGGAYADPNAWQQQQTTQQPQYNAQPQQQQQQQQPGIWNPMASMNTAANLASMATTFSNLGGSSSDEIIENFLKDSSARMIPGLQYSMRTLRPYFLVDNAYVVRKMKRVLLPFLVKSWKRQEKEAAPSADGTIPPVAYQCPVHDDCAPDLYLPLMSAITYVLLSALLYGTAGHFNPEVIPNVTTKCAVIQILEVAVIRLGFYLMQSPVALLDLFSYTGYKYLGLCINMLTGLIVGHFGLGLSGYYLTFVWTASATCWFMLKTMANNIPLHTAHTGPKREIMVFAFAASQLPTMWFVSQTKFL